MEHKYKIDDALKLNIYEEIFELKGEELKEKDSEKERLPEDVRCVLRQFIDEKPIRPYREGMGYFKNNEFIPHESSYISSGIGKLLKKYPAGLYIDIYKDGCFIFLEVSIRSPFSPLDTDYFIPEKVGIIKYNIGKYMGCQVSEESYTGLSELFKTIEDIYMYKNPFQRFLNGMPNITI